MTKELAILILKGDVLGTNEQTQEAVAMAVNALLRSDVPERRKGEADDWVEQIVDRLRNDPDAEWVEIIRCKDCKWYGRVDKRRFYRGMDCLQKHIDTIVPDRDFCSKAERRE